MPSFRISEDFPTEPDGDLQWYCEIQGNTCTPCDNGNGPGLSSVGQPKTQDDCCRPSRPFGYDQEYRCHTVTGIPTSAGVPSGGATGWRVHRAICNLRFEPERDVAVNRVGQYRACVNCPPAVESSVTQHRSEGHADLFSVEGSGAQEICPNAFFGENEEHTLNKSEPALRAKYLGSADPISGEACPLSQDDSAAPSLLEEELPPDKPTLAATQSCQEYTVVKLAKSHLREQPLSGNQFCPAEMTESQSLEFARPLAQSNSGISSPGPPDRPVLAKATRLEVISEPVTARGS